MKVKLISNKDSELEVGSNYLIINCEDREDANVYSNAYKYKDALEDVWELLFRPRHKHGYHNNEINNILGIDTSWNQEEINYSEKEKYAFSQCGKLMDCLEEIYQERLKVNNE